MLRQDLVVERSNFHFFSIADGVGVGSLFSMMWLRATSWNLRALLNWGIETYIEPGDHPPDGSSPSCSAPTSTSLFVYPSVSKDSRIHWKGVRHFRGEYSTSLSVDCLSLAGIAQYNKLAWKHMHDTTSTSTFVPYSIVGNCNKTTSRKRVQSHLGMSTSITGKMESQIILRRKSSPSQLQPTTQKRSQHHKQLSASPYPPTLLQTNGTYMFPLGIVFLISYIVWLVTSRLSPNQPLLLRRDSVEKFVAAFLRRQRKLRLRSSRRSSFARDVEALERLLPAIKEEDVEEEVMQTVTTTSIVSSTTMRRKSLVEIETMPEAESTVTTTHRVERVLKSCLRTRDRSVIIPIRASGCKGSRRSSGDEKAVSVRWGFSEKSNEGEEKAVSQCEDIVFRTPLEQVFLVDVIEHDWAWAEVDIEGLTDEDVTDDDDSMDGVNQQI